MRLLEVARAALPGLRWDSENGEVGADIPEVGTVCMWESERTHASLVMFSENTVELARYPADPVAWLREQVTARRDALNMALGEGWIPVGERLPPFGDDDKAQTFDVWADGKRVPNCFRSGYDDGWSWHQRDDWVELDDMNVTHWRNLPASPKE